MRTDESLLNAIDAVVKTAAPFGENAGYFVGQQEFEELKRHAHIRRHQNDRAADIKLLAADAVEAQQAANPRPLAEKLWHTTLAVMREGGNPAYQNSPLVRLYLHHLLWLLDKSSLPAYDQRIVQFGDDLDYCERVSAGLPVG